MFIPPTYMEPVKEAARHEALSHAVQLLTTYRSTRVCVRESYVREVRDHLAQRSNTFDASSASQLSSQRVAEWEEFHRAHVGRRTAGELAVCYLAGPYPSNDLDALVRLGINPHNIWAFESDAGTYEHALSTTRASRFPKLKLYKGSIENFFANTPKRFDLIYLDACGPIPSRGQQTLRMVATLLRHQRLASPGVLITNFASPDLSSPSQFDRYAHLVAHYLWPKGFLEGATTAGEPAAIEGPVFQGWQPKNFLDRVKADFGEYYGQYITRQIFDLATVIVPSLRMVNSYWGEFSREDPKVVGELAARLTTMSESEEDEIEPNGDALVESAEFPLVWSHAALQAEAATGAAPAPANFEEFRKNWLGELAGLNPPKIGAMDAVRMLHVLRLRHDLRANRFQTALDGFDYRRRMFQFCDVPTETLSFDVVTRQLAYPVHYSVSSSRRLRYTAKATPMYLDVHLFDECRYLYEWLPTMDLLAEGYSDIEQQLAFRFALDGLNKNRRWYNDEYFEGSAIVGQYTPPFEAMVLEPRRALT